MIQSIRNSFVYKIFLLIAAGMIFFLVFKLIYSDPSRATTGDSVQYWAAAKLVIEGANPYSAEAVLNLRHQVGNITEFQSDAISMMLYPPWTLSLILPFGVFEFEYFRIIWLLVHISLIFISTRLIWKYYQGPDNLIWIGYLVAFVFEPTILLLGIGHISTLHLLGLIGFLYFIQQLKKRGLFDFASGISVALVTIKPQFLIIFLIAILFWVIQQRRFLILLGGLSGLIFTSIISLLINPLVFHQYWASISQYPLGAWATPTFGSLIRLIFGYNFEWLQILPTLLGFVWFLHHWLRRKLFWNWKEDAPILILVSVVTAPYVWTYDMVLLLLPILQVIILSIHSKMKWVTNLLLVTYFFVNIFGLVIHTFLNEFWFFWFSPFVLLWYLSGQNLINRQHLITDNI